MTDIAALADHVYDLPDRELLWFASDMINDDCSPDDRDCILVEVRRRNLTAQLAAELGDDPEDYE